MKKQNQQNTKDLREAVEKLHNCHASHIEDVIIIEKFGVDTVWEGFVSVFKIKGNDKADKAYAWSSPIKGMINPFKKAGLLRHLLFVNRTRIPAVVGVTLAHDIITRRNAQI